MTSNVKNILLVEDTPDDRELIRLAFDAAGIDANFFIQDGQRAVDYLFSQGQYAGHPLANPPDVIILDLKLPTLSGFEVLKAIRTNAITAATPVIIFTSSTMQTDIATGYALGANSIITKPIDSEKFLECVRLLGVYWLTWNVQPPR